MADLPRLKLRTPVPFPANIAAGAGIIITKVNGVWTITQDLTTVSGLIGAGVVSGQASLDFGAFPGASDASVAVTGQATITSGAIVEVGIFAAATADHSADEHIANPPKVYAGNIQAGTGFTIYGVCPDGGDNRTYGSWTVNWRWQ